MAQKGHFDSKSIFNLVKIRGALVKTSDCEWEDSPKSIARIQMIYLQVNIHDKLFDEQGYYTYNLRWLLILNETSLETIESNVENITHLSVIQPIKVRHDKCY